MLAEAGDELLEAIKSVVTREAVQGAMAGPGDRYTIKVGYQLPDALDASNPLTPDVENYLWSLVSHAHYEIERVVKDRRLVSFTVKKRATETPKAVVALSSDQLHAAIIGIFFLIGIIVGFLLGYCAQK